MRGILLGLIGLHLVAALVHAPATRPHRLAPLAWRHAAVCAAEGCDEYDQLAEALAKVRELRSIEGDSRREQLLRWERAGKDPRLKVSGVFSNEPSFTRLFTHVTWEEYTGRASFIRWLQTGLTWQYSTILRAIAPICAAASLWAYCIASLPATLLPRTSPVPMSLMVTAIGLLLVFRTNNSYLRLAEARALWGSAILQIREVSQTVVTTLISDSKATQPAIAREGAARIAKYLAAFAWELNAKLTGPVAADDIEVLSALLPAEEAKWMGAQRSRPLHCLSALRREFHVQWREGNLPAHLHRKLEEDVRELDTIVGSYAKALQSQLERGPISIC